MIGPSILGIGVDLVDVADFGAALARTPELRTRLFTGGEIDGLSAESIAARFAAKEALAKALGAPTGLAWHDAVVVTDELGRTRLRVEGSVATVSAALGVRRMHLSLSQDGTMAAAVVVLEGT